MGGALRAPLPTGACSTFVIAVVSLVMVVSVAGTGGNEAEARQTAQTRGPSLSSALQ